MHIVSTNPFIAFLVVAEVLGSEQASAIIRLLKATHAMEDLAEMPVLDREMKERLYSESAKESVDLDGYHWQSLNPCLPEGRVTLSGRYLTIDCSVGYQCACLEAVYNAGLLCDERNPEHADLIASHRDYYAKQAEDLNRFWEV